MNIPRPIALAAWSVTLCAIPTLHAQLSVPSSYPNATLTAPTTSLLLAPADLPPLQTWWNTPSTPEQTAIRDSINTVAGSALSLSTPASLNETMTQASIAQAKALRWLLTSGDTSHADFQAVKTVLTQYAALSGGSDITGPLSTKGYAVAFDLINSHLNPAERSAIINRLQSQVVNKFASPSPANNHAVINHAGRGLYALLLGNRSNLNSALSGFATAYGNVTTDDGFFTDGDRYLNYTLGTTVPFMTAYINGGNDPAGSAQFIRAAEQQARYALGIRMPNGISPSFHNSDNAPLAIQELSRLVADPALKSATLWYSTQLGTSAWFSATNAMNNQYGMTDLMWTREMHASPAAPDWSPTFFSGGQARISVFRNDWGATSNYLATIAGTDGKIGSFAHADTGAITLAANGTQVIVEPGYARYNGFLGFGADSPMPNTPAGGSPNLNTSLPIEHNVLLARNAGTGTWGLGSTAKNLSQVSTAVTVTDQLDAAERGNFKGVADFSTLQSDYGTGSDGGNVHARRSTAMINESATSRGYFVMADSFRSTNAGNKDFAVNLIGKSKAENTQVMTSTPTYKKLRWSVDSYLGDYSSTNDPAAPLNYIQNPPYNQPVSGQVIAHIVSDRPMDSLVAHDSSWMVENWGVFIKTQRLRVSMSSTTHGAFLTFFETGPANFTSQWTVQPLSQPGYAAARIDHAVENWSDWHLSQTSATDLFSQSAGALRSIDGGALVSDAQYAYLRRSGALLDSAMISRGTYLESNGNALVGFSHPTTASFLFSSMLDGMILGTVSMDAFIPDTLLTLPGLPGPITSVLYAGQPLGDFNADSILLPYLVDQQSVSLQIAFIPEPSAVPLLLFAAGSLLARRRRFR